MLLIALLMAGAPLQNTAMQRLTGLKGSWSCQGVDTASTIRYAVVVEDALPGWLLFRFEPRTRGIERPVPRFLWLVGHEPIDPLLRLIDTGGWTSTFFGTAPDGAGNKESVVWNGKAMYGESSIPAR